MGQGRRQGPLWPPQPQVRWRRDARVLARLARTARREAGTDPAYQGQVQAGPQALGVQASFAPPEKAFASQGFGRVSRIRPRLKDDTLTDENQINTQCGSVVLYGDCVC